ncbi:YDG/SRA domain-containing protein [Vibrio splendidus]|uniref:YDG/SRA domain-containing protein n=1 Tax=Vibrio splendidus TaxID=29497 RepID=UPI000AC4B21E|nr:YDG/SRA domain-containing protein [Vibrio splendidus]
MADISFGKITGYEEGHLFDGRRTMMEDSFHRKWAAGIDSTRGLGASAIVLSSGYVDDVDYGDEIIYTGAGGNKDGKQIADQTWDNLGNEGLVTSMNMGIPVRVIRGHQHKSDYSPKKGYRYGGLYSVTEAWSEQGKHGFAICRFRLEYCGDYTEPLPTGVDPSNGRKRTYTTSTVIRLVRDSALALEIKKLYNFECQVCGFALPVKGGVYAEGAHIKPVGKPHEGPDQKNNILCLCPNHHAMFDKGSLAISDDFDLLGEVEGKLNICHEVDKEFLAYHRKIHNLG